MSPYQELLRLAQEQAASVARGDLDAAVQLIGVRAALLARTDEPTGSDLDAIREVLRLDGELSSAIRARMISIRDEALASQRGLEALNRYNPGQGPTTGTIDCAS